MRKHNIILSLLSLVLPLATNFVSEVNAQAFRYSVNSGSSGLDAAALKPSINQDHRYVTFHSQATNIESANDPSAKSDVFLSCQDIELITGNTPDGTQRTTHVSRGLSGNFANGDSSNSKISPDGRYIVFQSDASNLVSDDTNGVTDIFLYERPLSCNGNCNCTEESGVITRISRPIQNATFSGESNAASFNPQVSKDGCYVAFESDASNLNPKGSTGIAVTDNNSKRDVFMVVNPLANTSCKKRGCASGDCTITRDLVIVSALPVYTTNGLDIESEILGNGDSFSPSISPDGFVAFVSNSTNLSSQNSAGLNHIYVEAQCTLSGSTFAGKKLLIASVASDGTLANASSESPAIQQITGPVIVAFASQASNLVSGDTNSKQDIFTHVYQTEGACQVPGTTTRQSVATDGTQADGDSFRPSLTREAVLFSSDALNLANRTDCKGSRDIFVRVFSGADSCDEGEPRPVPRTELAGVSQAGYQPNAASDFPAIAPEFDQTLCPTNGTCGGSFVVYESAATNIVPPNTNTVDNDINGLTDVYGSLAIRNPCVLSADLTLKEPPQACTFSRSAEIYLQEFPGTKTVFSSSALSSTAEAKKPTQIKTTGSCGKKPEVCYELTLTPLKSNLKPNPKQTIRKLLDKRNVLTATRLPAGNYQASFKVKGDIGRSTKSPTVNFKVTR